MKQYPNPTDPQGKAAALKAIKAAHRKTEVENEYPMLRALREAGVIPPIGPDDYSAWLKAAKRVGLHPCKPTAIPFLDRLLEQAGFLEMARNVTPASILGVMCKAFFRAIGRPTMEFVKSWDKEDYRFWGSGAPASARAILAGAVRDFAMYPNRDAALILIAAVAALDTITTRNSGTGEENSLKTGEAWGFLHEMLDGPESFSQEARCFAEHVRDGYGLPAPHKDESGFVAAMRDALDPMASTGSAKDRKAAWVTKTLLILKGEPGIEVTKLARCVGKSRQSLYKVEEINRMLKMRKTGKVPHGYKTRGKDGTVDVEAIAAEE